MGPNYRMLMAQVAEMRQADKLVVHRQNQTNLQRQRREVIP